MITFNQFQIWKARVVAKLNGNREYVLQNLPADGYITGGSSLDVIFVARASGGTAGSVQATTEGIDSGSGSSGGKFGRFVDCISVTINSNFPISHHNA